MGDFKHARRTASDAVRKVCTDSTSGKRLGRAARVFARTFQRER